TTDTWAHPALPVGSDPSAILYDPASKNLYVANAGSSNVTVINGSTNSIQVRGIATGAGPVALADNPTYGIVLTANSLATNLTRILTSSNTVTAPVPLAAAPTSLGYSASTGLVAVGLPSSSLMPVVQASSGVVTALVASGVGVSSVVASLNGSDYVFANNTGTKLALVNVTTGTVISKDLDAVNTPSKLALDPSTGALYAWSNKSRTLTIVNLSTSMPTQLSPSLGARPGDAAYDPLSNRILSTDRTSNAIDFLNASSLSTAREPYLLPSTPDAIVDSPTSGIAYVGYSGGIQAIDAATGAAVVNNTTLLGNNTDLIVDTTANLLWDLNSVSGLLALHLSTLTGAILTGIGIGTLNLRGATFDPVTNELFSVDLTNSSIAVLNATTGLETLPWITSVPHAVSVAYDAADQLVYALGRAAYAISPVTGKIVSAPISVGVHVVAWSIVYDPSRADLYVATNGSSALLAPYSGNLTVIDGASLAASQGSIVTIPAGQLPLVAVPANLPGGSAPGSGEIWVANDASGTLSVIASPPQISYLAATPNPIDAGTPTTVSLAYIGGAGPSTISYTGLPGSCASANTTSLPCVPSGPGAYTIEASIVDSLGYTTSGSTILSVNPTIALTVMFAVPWPVEVDVGQTLGASVSISGGTAPISVAWAFGDGSTGSGNSVTHSYAAPGRYLLTVTATDAGGGLSSNTSAVSVMPLPSVVVSASPTNVTDPGIPVTLAASVSGGTALVSQSWSFGDGHGSSDSVAQHAYSSPGIYFATFTYVDASGNRASGVLTIQVNSPLSAQLTVVEGGSSIRAGSNLTLEVSVHGGTAPYTIIWGFGDGSYAYNPQVEHGYTTPGNYSISLFVEDAVGAQWNTTYRLAVTAVSTPAPSLTAGYETLFLGLVIGAAVAALLLYLAGRSRRRSPPPPTQYAGPESTGAEPGAEAEGGGITPWRED
ncbi:MAG TPA: PKD domain-containing protein, partial [Thermoplasmata archaeon]|nr:PKD domain-containing protein [Thermoplasmata archaeon]